MVAKTKLHVHVNCQCAVYTLHRELVAETMTAIAHMYVYIAPCSPMQACLTSVPGALCSGEVCRVGVEVYNCGQVPLNSLRITTSLAQRVLLDKVQVIVVP